MTYDEAAAWLESVNGTCEAGQADGEQDEVAVQVGRMSRRVAYRRVNGPVVAKREAAHKAFVAACAELRGALEEGA